MNKEKYIEIANEKLNGRALEIMIEQINKYFQYKDINIEKKKYNLGDMVFLPKGTLLHGTYQNINGLPTIVEEGLISNFFVDTGRVGKYPACVGVWNLQEDYKLSEYIDFYSGGYFRGKGYENNYKKDIVLSYTELNNNLNKYIEDKKIFSWDIVQTKEARYLPNITQDVSQIGIIYNSDNIYIKDLLKLDILDAKNINDEDVKDFVNSDYYDYFIKARLNKDIYFTNRESAVLFGIPSNFIEGILVGREYEGKPEILSQIKELLPNAYICNLSGKVIVE